MDDLSHLQKSVLEKYTHLAKSLHSLDNTIKQLNANKHEESPEQVLQQLREIEVKIALAGTLFKGSVYSLVLQKNGLQK
ncbi:LAFE_0C06414g1_1 [Lachancea fermentati]|uniref:DASH complex subunit DAD3 n=1 Tax=Lachancea fermentati TaxID=4955 RepID=A0A1G4M9I8_LACFM|nr:LAFE_0C06414g1_1 [Lachancea fermentati]